MRSIRSFSSLSAIVAVSVGLTVIDARARAERDASPLVFRSPVRRPVVIAPEPPPSLPTMASEIGPATLELQLLPCSPTGESAGVRTVVRTGDRVHVQVDESREWLYVRNPVDPRRVSGLLTDHLTRTTVAYSESDLRNVLGIRGWIDVLTVGMEPSQNTVPSASEDGGNQLVPPCGRVSVRQVKPLSHPERLVDPARRFPRYRQIEYPDWLEGLGDRQR